MYDICVIVILILINIPLFLTIHYDSLIVELLCSPKLKTTLNNRAGVSQQLLGPFDLFHEKLKYYIILRREQKQSLQESTSP